MFPPLFTLRQNPNNLNAPLKPGIGASKQNRNGAALYRSTAVVGEGAEGVERGGGFFSFSAFTVPEECDEGVDGAGEGSDGGLVDVEDGEAGEKGGGEGAAVGGGGGEE